MLTRRGLAPLALLAACSLVALAALPGTARAAGQQAGAAASGTVVADAIRDSQQWVLEMLNVPAAWAQTEGAGVTVAVIDSGVNPYVSDLTGSVVTGPDYTGVSTPPSSPDWGVHGTWMASLIVGHGDDGGGSGIIGIAPSARVLSIRVIPDRGDPHYGQYEHEQETRIQQSLANGINYAVTHGAKVISMSIGYSAPSATVRVALQQAYDHGVVVVASAGNSGDQSGSGDDGDAPESFPADYPGVISVGAVDSSGTVAAFPATTCPSRWRRPGCPCPRRAGTGTTGGSAVPARPARWWPGWPRWSSRSIQASRPIWWSARSPPPPPTGQPEVTTASWASASSTRPPPWLRPANSVTYSPW